LGLIKGQFTVLVFGQKKNEPLSILDWRINPMGCTSFSSN